ncbi:hypothetical protein Pelo_3161 [Pelomyxa schiedti]|nr:hypothetical protein Pelo_3161 [Pelomyxa schiedti]
MQPNSNAVAGSGPETRPFKMVLTIISISECIPADDEDDDEAPHDKYYDGVAIRYSPFGFEDGIINVLFNDPAAAAIRVGHHVAVLRSHRASVISWAKKVHCVTQYYVLPPSGNIPFRTNRQLQSSLSQYDLHPPSMLDREEDYSPVAKRLKNNCCSSQRIGTERTDTSPLSVCGTPSTNSPTDSRSSGSVWLDASNLGIGNGIIPIIERTDTPPVPEWAKCQFDDDLGIVNRSIPLPEWAQYQSDASHVLPHQLESGSRTSKNTTAASLAFDRMPVVPSDPPIKDIPPIEHCHLEADAPQEGFCSAPPSSLDSLRHYEAPLLCCASGARVKGSTNLAELQKDMAKAQATPNSPFVSSLGNQTRVTTSPTVGYYHQETETPEEPTTGITPGASESPEVIALSTFDESNRNSNGNVVIRCLMILSANKFYAVDRKGCEALITACFEMSSLKIGELHLLSGTCEGSRSGDVFQFRALNCTVFTSDIPNMPSMFRTDIPYNHIPAESLKGLSKDCLAKVDAMVRIVRHETGSIYTVFFPGHPGEEHKVFLKKSCLRVARQDVVTLKAGEVVLLKQAEFGNKQDKDRNPDIFLSLTDSGFMCFYTPDSTVWPREYLEYAESLRTRVHCGSTPSKETSSARH